MIQDIKLSSEFKKQALKAILAIMLFAFVYLLIIILAIGLTIACYFLGTVIMGAYPSLMTILVWLGLCSLGVLILIFLFKFLFATRKVDRSHLVEITAEQEPELFQMIDDIVFEVGTKFPKSVYLSAEVNAAVFYDSNFWSMLWPVKKNLQIGLGLINSVSKAELKAILSHEFGHFSQRTMKVGSYVYNVNQVIYNMLYDNSSYQGLIKRWARISSYFGFFVMLAVWIIQKVQLVLKQMYSIVNLSYMGLSREMEFHADEIAANVTGYQPLINALLRLSLANHALDAVFKYYNANITNNLKSANLYTEQAFVMNFLASEDAIPLENGLPLISESFLERFNQSKLVIKDQWASHPGLEERIAHLKTLGLTAEQIDSTPAVELFHDIYPFQQQLTEMIFEKANYEGEIKVNPVDSFKLTYEANYGKNAFDKIYNGYYDNKNPEILDLKQADPDNACIDFSDLFSQKKLNLVYQATALKNDINALKQIAENKLKIKSFDYDGKRFKQQESLQLLEELNIELKNVKQQVKANDGAIFQYFRRLEHQAVEDSHLIILYKVLYKLDKNFDDYLAIYNDLSHKLQFVKITTPFEVIKENFRQIKELEDRLKIAIRVLLEANTLTEEITEEIQSDFNTYLSENLIYFHEKQYNHENLQLLFGVKDSFYSLLLKAYYISKRNLLSYQSSLLQMHVKQASVNIDADA